MSLTHFRRCYFVKKDYKKINKRTIFHFENHVFLKSIVEKHLCICNMRSCNPTEKCIKGSSINHVYMQGGKSKFILIHKPYLVKCSRNGGMGVKKSPKTIHMVYGWPQGISMQIFATVQILLDACLN